MPDSRRGRRSAPHREDPDVIIVYPHLPHYRERVFRHLADHCGLLVEFVADTESRDRTIPTVPPGEFQRFHRVRNRWLGPVLWQAGLIGHLLARRPDAVIFLGDVSYLTTWIAGGMMRIRRCPVLFWTIGWHRPEKGLKRFVRLAFYRLANGLLLYGRTGEAIGRELGYPADRMFVVGNSHDIDIDAALLPTIHHADQFEGRAWVGAVVRPNANKRLDQLLHAVCKLRAESHDVGVIIVGEGHANAELVALASELDVPLRMPGALHDVGELARIYSELLVTVVPEAAGLTAIQSLWFGRPVITCSDPFRQMPESECVIPGRTGDLFPPGNVGELAAAIERWIERVRTDPAAVAEDCRREARSNWTSDAHAQRIRIALDAIVG